MRHRLAATTPCLRAVLLLAAALQAMPAAHAAQTATVSGMPTLFAGPGT
jgi:uncharacterized protein YraI